jgi:hypothetical protein
MNAKVRAFSSLLEILRYEFKVELSDLLYYQVEKNADFKKFALDVFRYVIAHICLMRNRNASRCELASDRFSNSWR